MSATEAQAAAAIVILKRMIDAAENGNQAGEDAVVAAAAGLSTLAALDELQAVFAIPGEDSFTRFERLAAMFYKDTGYLAPGKSAPMHSTQPDGDELRAIYDTWYVAKVERARAAIARATGAA